MPPSRVDLLEGPGPWHVSGAVFGAMLALGQSHYLIQLLLVSFQGGEVESEH